MKNYISNGEEEEVPIVAATPTVVSTPPTKPSSTDVSTLRPLEILSRVLANRENFTIDQPNIVNGITLALIYDSDQHPILSIVTKPSLNNCNTLFPPESVIEMYAAGQLIITGKINEQLVTIFSGEEILGQMKTNTEMDYSFLVHNTMGVLVFQSDEMLGLVPDDPTEIILRIKEKTLAQIRMSESGMARYELFLFNSQNLDLGTNALLIFASYFSYMAFIQQWSTFNNSRIPLIKHKSMMETLQLLNEAVTNHKRLTIGHPSFTSGNTLVSFYDSDQHPILSVLTTPLANTSVNASSSLIPCASLIEIKMAEQLIITGKENAQLVSISSGNRDLGQLEENLIMESSFLVRNIKGDLVCRSDRNSGTGPLTEIVISTKVSNLARIRTSESSPSLYEVVLLDSKNLDLRTNALLIFTCYFSYMYFTQRSVPEVPLWTC